MSKLIDITGKRFGFWIVEKQQSNDLHGHSRWLCKCECGNKKIVTSNSLRTGNSTSCGCNHVPNLIGQKFGTLKVMGLIIKNNKRKWECKCDCGSTMQINTYRLRGGLTKYCKHKHEEGYLECFVKIIIPHSKCDEIIKEAEVLFSNENTKLEKPILAISINTNDSILSLDNIKSFFN